MFEIYCCVYFSQQMILRHQHICTQHFDCLSLFLFFRQHLHHLSSVYQKKAARATFFDRLRPAVF